MPTGGLFHQEEERGSGTRESSGTGPGRFREAKDIGGRLNRSAFLLLALLAILAATSIVSADTWMQPRGDAAATGFQPEDGPEWPDVAIRAELPGSMRAEADSPPLVLEDEVLFLARPYNDPGDTDYRVFSVDVHTGEVTTVAEDIKVANRLRMATDGETLYVSSRGTVHAFPLEAGGNEWTWDGVVRLTGTDVADHQAVFCGRMSLSDGSLTVLCQSERFGQRPFSEGSARGSVLVAQLDADTGDLDWYWDVPRSPQDGEPAGYGGAGSSYPVGLAASDSYVVILTKEGSVSCVDCSNDQFGVLRSDAWGLSSDGDMVWNRTLQQADRLQMTYVEQASIDENEPFLNVGNPAITDGAVYVKAGRMHKLNLGTGDTLWSTPIGEEDIDQQGGRSGAVSLTDLHVFTTSAQTLYRIDRDEPKDGWSRNLDFASEEGFGENTIVTPSAVYNTVWHQEEIETLVAFDSEDGSILWRHPATDIFSFSVGEGLAAYTDVEFHDNGTATTTLVVLGRTDASPTASANPATAYPAPGERVEVDFADSEPGVQGEAMRFKAIWGDGTESDWQPDPVLTHAYAEPGDVIARFLIANEANQTASSTYTFYVGQEEPTEPNWVSERFEPENQEMTFGVLGLLVAVTGGAIGVARSYRERIRLQDVLKGVETAYEETQHNPAECEAQLTERKTHARGLMLDGKLREEQLQVVDNRIQELRTELRMDTLKEGFEDLPHRVVRALEEMLKDGRITSMEHQGAHAAIDEAKGLTDAYKERLREQVDAWHNRDARGHGAR